MRRSLEINFFPNHGVLKLDVMRGTMKPHSIVNYKSVANKPSMKNVHLYRIRSHFATTYIAP